MEAIGDQETIKSKLWEVDLFFYKSIVTGNKGIPQYTINNPNTRTIVTEKNTVAFYQKKNQTLQRHIFCSNVIVKEEIKNEKNWMQYL